MPAMPHTRPLRLPTTVLLPTIRPPPTGHNPHISPKLRRRHLGRKRATAYIFLPLKTVLSGRNGNEREQRQQKSYKPRQRDEKSSGHLQSARTTFLLKSQSSRPRTYLSRLSRTYVKWRLQALKTKTDSDQKHHHKDQKIDDEDGHYIVVPEAELTERCEWQIPYSRRIQLIQFPRHNRPVTWAGHIRQSRRSV